MQRALVVKGRLTGPTTVELDEPVTEAPTDVEVILHVSNDHVSDNGPGPVGETLFEFLHRLPPGTRTKEDIDRQLREERDSWGDR